MSGGGQKHTTISSKIDEIIPKKLVEEYLYSVQHKLNFIRKNLVLIKVQETTQTKNEEESISQTNDEPEDTEKQYDIKHATLYQNVFNTELRGMISNESDIDEETLKAFDYINLLWKSHDPQECLLCVLHGNKKYVVFKYKMLALK
jgi:hypothetical protein